MKKLNCLIVDDELMARQGLEQYARQMDCLEIKGVCKNAMLANALLQEQHIDLLFLDINMPQLSGMDLLKKLENPPFVVFTTAYSEYALASFEFDVIDYLVKPISFDRFIQAVNKANRLIHQQGDNDYFFVKSSGRLVKVFQQEICYIESVQNYVSIVTEEDKHLVLMPLKAITELMPSGLLLQIHRSCYVAVKHIDLVEGNRVVVCGHELTISKRMRPAVMRFLAENKGITGN